MNKQHGRGLPDDPVAVAQNWARGEIGAGDPLPPGPYTVGMTVWESFGEGPPWTVRCADGRAVAGHVPSREIADAIAAALNKHWE